MSNHQTPECWLCRGERYYSRRLDEYGHQVPDNAVYPQFRQTVVSSCLICNLPSYTTIA